MTLWRQARAGLRALGFALVTLVVYPSVLAGLLFTAFTPRARTFWQGLWFRIWSVALCAVLGVRVRVRGTPPRRPFFLVANHLSYLDIIVLGTRLPCVFVAKGEIDRWPVMGALCRSVNTVFIDRTLKRDIPRAMQRVHDLLARGQGVVIFPESTSSSGAGVLPFRSPLLELAVRLELPVHWAVLSYATPNDDPPARDTVCWWGDMPFGPHVAKLLRLDRVEASLVFGDQPVLEIHRKELAGRLYEAVAGAFVPVSPGIQAAPQPPAEAPVRPAAPAADLAPGDRAAPLRPAARQR